MMSFSDSDLAELALASGAMQLGEKDFIFNVENLARLVALLAEPPKLAPLPY